MIFDKILRESITKVQSWKDERNTVKENNGTKDIKKA